MTSRNIRKASRVYIYCCSNTQDLSSPTLETVLGWLPETMRRKALAYKRWQDRQAYVAGRLLLVDGFKTFFNTQISLNSLQYTKNSKPFIENSQVDFNISHSGTQVVCAFAANCHVGIDIELKSNINAKEFKKYFTDNEMTIANRSIEDFYWIWTRKEAVLKAVGTGLTDRLHELNVTDDPICYEGYEWHFLSPVVDKQHICTVVSDRPFELEPGLKLTDLHGLIQAGSFSSDMI